MHACLRLLCLLLCTLTGSASQAAWPERPIRMIVPYAPGSSPDNICRLLAQEMARSLGVNILIDNRAGASGSVGTEAIAKAAADGYTIGYGNIGTLTTNRFMIAKLPYDPDRDLTLIGSMGAVQNMLAVNNNLPVKSVRDLIALAKKSPGKLNVPVGLGSNIHMSTLALQQRVGAKWTYIPTKGGQSSVMSVMTGDGDFLFMGVLQTWVHVKSGKLKLIAVSSEAREPMFPQVPTVAETPGLEGFSAGSWQGILGPGKMPADITNKLYNEVKRIVALPDVNEKMTSQGSRPQAKTPQELGAWLASEKDKWLKVVKESGYKIE